MQAPELIVFDWSGTLADMNDWKVGADGRTYTPLMPGVPALLSDLDASGILMGIATALSRRGLDEELVYHDIGQYFVATRGGDEGFNKPHPEMLLEILEQTGVKPENALMVGDTSADYQMAQAANVDVVMVGRYACAVPSKYPNALAYLPHIADLSKVWEK